MNAKHIIEKRIYENDEWPLFKSALKERLKLMNDEIILVKKY